MTRPKVPDDKRQRTAQACDSCKRRKQKCNGLKPCQTCLRRKLMCCYTPSSASDHVADSSASPTKRRHIDTSPPSISSALETSEASASASSPPDRDAMQTWDHVRKDEQQPGDSSMSGMTAPQLPLSMPVPDHVRQGSFHNFRRLPSRNHANGLSEETNIYTETRMLQDQTGRLLYIGDASTLSILQLIRIIVENTAGSDMGSPFIDDPKRHRLLENIIEFPPNVRIPSPLPDKKTADILIASYFTNTCGLIEILDRSSFLRLVEDCYRDPLSSSNDFLCSLYLVLALGLLLAAPAPGSHEEVVVQKQLTAQPDRAEVFFRSARSMCDPGAGFEDADFWSIQALSLMTIYMLIVSKRNTAYAYLGMAVRSAYALGLHREETMRDVIFTPGEMTVRRNLWKTLFILDRFLAATLGRPTAISEDDCSCKILPHDDALDLRAIGGLGFDHVHASSLNSCVETSRVIGVTLKVFSRRKISTTKVQEIIDMSRNWDQASRAQSYRRQSDGGPVNPAHGVASLHVSLLSLHSLILLTRQLFVMHNWMLVEERSGIKKSPQIRESIPARFSEACVVASYKTIKLARAAWEDNYLPRRNPFIVYFIFAASLVILMNQFSSLYYTEDYAETMRDAIDIMEYCAEIDPQARRVLDIITRFSEVVTKWTKDHAYPAPHLADDFSCLYNQTARPVPTSEHMHPGPATNTGFQRRTSSHAASGSDPGLLTPPSMPKLPLLDILSTQTPSAVREARVNGMTPPHTHVPPISLVGGRPSVSAHSSIGSSEPLSGNIEFEFDGLWNSFINHLPPVSSVAPGISGLAMQFPPPVIGAPTEPYDKPGF
ncbi:fungal-specific transcription factor domain-containing protein [Chaetomidium leptoderma]|uniref:Fungal-specific transcription factor domain-containing protein n=1 Tax=Chaetomidium leptoderma TaxID=669021 RepID=A0AAN7A1J1_9PEZI|nr:fungal-specific transcription factor domain-containing protein [Chaetomidium leptoderma]